MIQSCEVKNLITASAPRHLLKVRVAGAPPLRGWTLKYVSGIEDAETKPGYLLEQWDVSSDRMNVAFSFAPDAAAAFTEESEARQASTALRDGGVATEVVKLD